MNKKIFFILFVITFAVVFYIIFSLKKQEVFRSPIITNEPLLSPTESESSNNTEKKYSDASGFSFFYPANIIVNKIETKNETIYSSLEIISKKETGKISFLVTSTNLKKVDDYFTDKKKEIKKLKIAEMEARQIAEEKKITTVALDQGALFTIMVDYQTSKDFWVGVNNKIISTFAFTPPEQTETTSQGSAGSQEDVIYEGEEEIQ